MFLEVESMFRIAV